MKKHIFDTFKEHARNRLLNQGLDVELDDTMHNPDFVEEHTGLRPVGATIVINKHVLEGQDKGKTLEEIEELVIQFFNEVIDNLFYAKSEALGYYRVDTIVESELEQISEDHYSVYVKLLLNIYEDYLITQVFNVMMTDEDILYEIFVNTPDDREEAYIEDISIIDSVKEYPIIQLKIKYDKDEAVRARHEELIVKYIDDLVCVESVDRLDDETLLIYISRECALEEWID